jgi:antitoxin (DNA-binding transcriptional repressor) of toxin-antitoxin stability system
VARGDEVIIARGGKPVACLVPVQKAKRMDQLLGIDTGRLWIAEDFDGPLPEEMVAAFEVDCVVIEHGVAELRGSSIRERTRRLIAIAHPKFRDELAGKAREMGYQ